MNPQTAIYALTGLWLLSWAIAAGWSGRRVAATNPAAEAGYRVIVVIGALLLYGSGGRHPALEGAIGWAFVGLAAIGFGFCWWARVHLGRLWSANVERKEGHVIVESGPYGLVRHPIYTGMLTAFIALAAVEANARALIGLAFLTVGYVIKALLEERLMRASFGDAAYDDYSRRTPMLVPWRIFAPAR